MVEERKNWAHVRFDDQEWSKLQELKEEYGIKTLSDLIRLSMANIYHRRPALGTLKAGRPKKKVSQKQDS